jgi:hypothetical protein
MKSTTTAEEYYEAIKSVGAGTLYYLTKKLDSSGEFVFEPLVIDTKKKDLTIRILKRAMLEPNFIAFPGTPEMDEFANSDLK